MLLNEERAQRPLGGASLGTPAPRRSVGGWCQRRRAQGGLCACSKTKGTHFSAMSIRKSDDRVYRFHRQILNLALLEGGDRVLAAVSGGPDSVALAMALSALSRDPELALGWAIVHINHHLRGTEADRDEEFCRKLALRLDVEFQVRHVDIPEFRKEHGGSAESVARKERYRLLGEAAVEYSASKVALGHHADDNVETILHRIFRGTGLHGLAGIPVRRQLLDSPPVEIIRPLLGVSRDEILEYLGVLGQGFCEDSTNSCEQHTRNWIRHSLLPELELNVNPSARENVLRLAGHAADAEAFLLDNISKVIGSLPLEVREGEARVDAGALVALAPPVRAGVVSEIVSRVGGPAQGLLSAHQSAISGLLESGDGEVCLPGGLVARLESGGLLLTQGRDDAQSIEPLLLEVPGTACLPDGRTISASLRPGPAPSLGETRRLSERVAYLDWSRVSPPLCVRGHQPGDRFLPLGLGGQQKLKDFFINAKVPRSARGHVPLVVDSQHILWVVGHRLSEDCKLRPETRTVLEVWVEEAGP